jgi:hypothetical protein
MAQLRWLNDNMMQSFYDFEEQYKLIKYHLNPTLAVIAPAREAVIDYKVSNQKNPTPRSHRKPGKYAY